MTAKELAGKLNRKPRSLQFKIRALKLHKNLGWLPSETVTAILTRERETDFPLRVIADEFHLSVYQVRCILKSHRVIHSRKGVFGWHRNGYRGVHFKSKKGKSRMQLLDAYKNTCWDCKETLLSAALIIHHDWGKMPVEVVVLCRQCHKKRHSVQATNNR